MSYVHYLWTQEDVVKLLEHRDEIYDEGWWPHKYLEGCHFATMSEVREYLALCVELGESFTTDSYMAVFGSARYPMAAVHYVADLLEKAEWTPSGENQNRLYAPEKYLIGVDLTEMELLDKRADEDVSYARPELIRQYLQRNREVAQQFSGHFLQNAPKIAAASALLGRLRWYWDEMESCQRWRHRASCAEEKYDKMSWVHWWKRSKLADQADLSWGQEYACRRLMEVALSQLQNGMYCCYDSFDRERVDAGLWPVTLCLAAKGTANYMTVKDMSDEVGVHVRWEDSELTRSLGKEQLERALELHRYVMTMVQMSGVGTGGNLDSITKEIEEGCPGIPRDLHPYLLCEKGNRSEGGPMSIAREMQRRKIREKEGLAV